MQVLLTASLLPAVVPLLRFLTSTRQPGASVPPAMPKKQSQSQLTVFSVLLRKQMYQGAKAVSELMHDCSDITLHLMHSWPGWFLTLAIP